MSENVTIEETEIEDGQAQEIDPIEVIYTGECLSLSGRSTLTFEIGRHSDNDTLHLRIIANTGKGMFCKDWASASAIQIVVFEEPALTAKSFQCLHEGRSINTAGFILAAVRELGLIEPNAENTRLHEHVPTTTFAQVVHDRIAASKATSKQLRKKG